MSGHGSVADGALFSSESIREKIAVKSAFFTQDKRELLYDELVEQHKYSQLADAQHENLASLLTPRTFTVTTGHQLNLFTGPVFFIYKILQTIKLAESLKRDCPDLDFVPVFWMATEDHDFEEINHFSTAERFFEVNGHAGGPVGRMKVDDQFFITAFDEEFRNSVFGTELILMMKKAYKKGNTFAEATRMLVQELFGSYGILIVDGDCKKWKASVTDLFQEELLHETLLRSTQETREFLKKKYGKVQVNPRNINLFYLSDTRNRIEKRENQYFIVDKDLVFSEEEILKELNQHPENFSPNAVLRPAYQEAILPNIAYIGGNAEIMYWLELTSYFKTVGIPFPYLIPRSSMLMVSEKNLRKIEKFGLKITDFLQDFASLSRKVLVESNELTQMLSRQENELKKQFLALSEAAVHTDVTFLNMVRAEEQRQLKSFERLRKRLLRAEKIKQSEKMETLERLFREIHPSGVWQERVYNFSVFYADAGQEWLQTCYQEIGATNSELIIFSI